MPLQVKCRKCGYIIEERDVSNFDYFDPYNLPRKCPNCGRIFDSIQKTEVNVFPFDKTLKTNNKRKSYGRIHRYIFTASMNSRMTIQCHHEDCGKRIKVGDKVVSVRTSRGRRIQYHEECYKKKFASRKVFQFIFRHRKEENLKS